MKRMLFVFLAFVLMISLAGCGEPEKPDISVDDISSWVSDTYYMDNYDYVVDWSITLDDSGNLLYNIVVENGTDPELAVQVADGLVRYVSAYACSKCDELTSPGKDDYGSFYDYYDALVGVSEKSKTSNTKDWLVFHAIVDSSGPLVKSQN